MVEEKPSDFLSDPKDGICLVREVAGAKFAKAGLNAVHTLRRRQGSEMTSMHLRENMYMVTVYLTDHPEAQDVWKDGHHAMRPAMRAGAISLFDMRYHWEGDNMAPFEALNFFIPDLAFDETARELGSTFSGFNYDVAREYRDDVATSLARAVLPALDSPAEIPMLFVDHVFSALRSRLLVAYCGLNPTGNAAGPKLSDHEVARIKELLLDDVGADRSVAELAQACGLSAGQFSRAFKRTLGTSPHQWLVEQRIDRARYLLRGKKSISEIALECGFADQSHLSRVFLRKVGLTPGEWRRAKHSDA
ncbi:AraC family transcriptional regulator [uncultured Bradyrhizobium sp.]|jgi:AraC-like DNA-binding protein|uniref:AraC family transcriptional regulator n=1 Tax=uncultured Bradyrhizobium sp. TaxID=199684 RepID=UPI002609D67B|nr:AraC family transcriptional regulator [uncultured Bradyrhizobium sp.]